jgi:hypothetical protein
MKRISLRVFRQITLLVVLSCSLFSFAISRAIWGRGRVFATYINLAVLHILVTDKQTGQAIQGLRAQDFEVFDNGEPARIVYFIQTPKPDVEPVVLWLIDGCVHKYKNVQEQNGNGDAAEFLKPSLEQLNPEDMVGVAHWCPENNIAQVDLEPTKDRAAPAIALNSVIRQNSGGPRKEDGTHAVQKVLQLVHAAAPSFEQSPYTAVTFLDSDVPNVSQAETTQLAGDLLSHTSLVVNEVNHGIVARSKLTPDGRIALLPYLSQETGGQVVSLKAKTVGEALQAIVISLHSRYVLAFIPSSTVGEWHALKVKLAKTAMEKHEGALLSYRSGYPRALPIDFSPVSESPVDKGRDFDAALSLALKSDSPISDISFEADGATYEGLALNARFSVNLDGEPLHWNTQSDGYDRSEITVVTAFFSAQGEIIQKKLKHYEVVRRKEGAWTAQKKSFRFFLYSDIPATADRIRILIRDDASGKVGFQDLPMEKVLKAAKLRAVIAENRPTDRAQPAAPL